MAIMSGRMSEVINDRHIQLRILISNVTSHLVWASTLNAECDYLNQVFLGDKEYDSADRYFVVQISTRLVCAYRKLSSIFKDGQLT